MACAMLFSCHKEIEAPIQPEQPVQEEVKTYTLTVNAGKGDTGYESHPQDCIYHKH